MYPGRCSLEDLINISERRGWKQIYSEKLFIKITEIF
jgi:hypothetical protein